MAKQVVLYPHHFDDYFIAYIKKNINESTSRTFIEYGYVDGNIKVYAAIDYVVSGFLIGDYKANTAFYESCGLPYYVIKVTRKKKALQYQIIRTNSSAKVQYEDFKSNFYSTNAIRLGAKLSEDYWYHWLKFIRTGSSLYQQTCSNVTYTLHKGNTLVDIVAYRHQALNTDWYMTDIDAVVYDNLRHPIKAVLLEVKRSNNGYINNNISQDAVYDWLVKNSKFKKVNAYKVSYLTHSNKIISIQIDKKYGGHMKGLPCKFNSPLDFIFFVYDML